MYSAIQSAQSEDPLQLDRTTASGCLRPREPRFRFRLGAGLYLALLMFAGPLPSSAAADSSEEAEIESDGLRSIGGLSVDIRPADGELPDDPAAVRFAALGEVRHPLGTNRPWGSSCFNWEAPAVCHRPLYFEQVNLERYGYSHGVAQPLVSAAHFFGTVPALPYLIAAEPSRRCVYTLGHYRPGSCAPYHIHRPPLSLRGAAAEAAVVTGLIFAMP